MTSLGVHMCFLWIIKIASLYYLVHSTIEFKCCKSVGQNYVCIFLMCLCWSQRSIVSYCVLGLWGTSEWGMLEHQSPEPTPSRCGAFWCVSVWENATSIEKGGFISTLEHRGFPLVSLQLSPVWRQATVKLSEPWPFWSLDGLSVLITAASFVCH